MKKQINKQKFLYYILLLASFWKSTSLITVAAASKIELKSAEGEIDFDCEYKMIFLGDGNVGKTAICNNIQRDEFSQHYSVTYMNDHKDYSLVLGDKKIKASIWDTAGKERYARITQHAYKDTDCIILCYDITYEDSFISCKERWEEEIENSCNKDPFIILCGTKQDLVTKRKITQERAKELAAHFANLDFIKGAVCLETSAKSGYQINKLIDIALQSLVNYEPRQYGKITLAVGTSVTFSDTSDYPNQKGKVTMTYPTSFKVKLDNPPGTIIMVNSKKLSKGIIKVDSSSTDDDEPSALPRVYLANNNPAEASWGQKCWY